MILGKQAGKETMNRLILLLALALMIGCNSAEPTAEEVTQNESSQAAANDVPEPGTSGVEITEYIAWDSLKLNNQLVLGTNLREVETVFGKADSTITPDYSNICPNCHFCTMDIPPFKEVYFKGVNFEQLNDSLIFWSADFSSNKTLFLQSGSMRLDHKTTLEDFKKRFPEAVKNADKEEEEVWVRIGTAKQPTDDAFILTFNKEGYLMKFFYWFPC